MKILSWNCRGFRKTTAVQRCRKIVRAHSPDFVFLSETKLSVNSASSSLANLGFNHFTGTNAVNLGGGTLVAWSSAFVVDILVLSPHVCHCQVTDNVSSLSYYLSFIYGPLVLLIIIFFGIGSTQYLMELIYLGLLWGTSTNFIALRINQTVKDALVI